MSPAVAAADAVSIKVLTSNSTHQVLAALATAFEGSSQIKVSISVDSAKVMLARVKDGETADAAVLLASDLDELVKVGTIDARSRRLFARSRIGIAVRTGAAKPDIGSVDGLRRTLLNARSVAHTLHGASGMYVPVLLERLGIANEVKPKIVTRPGGLIGKVVAAGEAEIAVQQISELLAVPGIELVGPLPEEVQLTFESAAGIFVSSNERAAAEALLDFFAAPAAVPLFVASGLDPVRG